MCRRQDKIQASPCLKMLSWEMMIGYSEKMEEEKVKNYTNTQAVQSCIGNDIQFQSICVSIDWGGGVTNNCDGNEIENKMNPTQAGEGHF